MDCLEWALSNSHGKSQQEFGTGLELHTYLDNLSQWRSERGAEGSHQNNLSKTWLLHSLTGAWILSTTNGKVEAIALQ